MDKKKVAFIGAGNIFEAVHYKHFSRHSDFCEISAIVGVSAEKVETLAKKYNIPYYFTSTEEMFKIVKPNIVSVCTPNKFHFENVDMALDAGCHVLCEKPPAIDSIQAKKMKEKANEKNLVLAYNLNFRHSQNVAFLKKQFDAGDFGDIYNVKVHALRRRGVPGWGNFINKDIQGGGPLIDIGVHMLDTALYLMGYPKVKSIMASSYTEIGNKKSKGTNGSWNPEKYTVEDSVFALLKFENGASLILETSFALNIKENNVMNVWLHGSEAGASVFPLEIYKDMNDELVDVNFPFSAEEDTHEKSIDNFISKCKGTNAMIANGEEGYILQSIIDGIYKSAETGVMITL